MSNAEWRIRCRINQAKCVKIRLCSRYELVEDPTADFVARPDRVRRRSGALPEIQNLFCRGERAFGEAVRKNCAAKQFFFCSEILRCCTIVRLKFLSRPNCRWQCERADLTGRLPMLEPRLDSIKPPRDIIFIAA